jgi:hypothetical protein
MMSLRAAIFLVPGLLAPVSAVAADAVATAYELTWGGIEVGRFDTRLTVDGASYRLAYAARTTGFLGWLYPFSSSGASEGSLADPGPVPARYMVESHRRAYGTSWGFAVVPHGHVDSNDPKKKLE